MREGGSAGSPCLPHPQPLLSWLLSLPGIFTFPWCLLCGSKEGGEVERGGDLPSSWRSSEKAGLVGLRAGGDSLQAGWDPVQ